MQIQSSLLMQKFYKKKSIVAFEVKIKDRKRSLRLLICCYCVLYSALLNSSNYPLFIITLTI